MRTSMLVLASGRGTRFGGEVPKVFVACRGRTLLERSIARLAAATDQREIIVAAHPDDRRTHIEPLRAELEALGVTAFVDGGKTRQQSMRNALAACDPDFELVLVHDAARPYPPVDAIRTALARAAEVGAALLALPVADTLKREGPTSEVAETIDRRGIWRAQTPQVIRRDVLENALAVADRDGFEGTDDVSLVEHAGGRVALVAGATTNLKVTTRADLELAERIAAGEDQDP